MKIIPECLKKRTIKDCIKFIESNNISNTKYILKFGDNNFYIGEERYVQFLDEDNECICVQDFCIVDDIQKALPIPANKLKVFNDSIFVSYEYQNIYGVLYAINYCSNF